MPSTSVLHLLVLCTLPVQRQRTTFRSRGSNSGCQSWSRRLLSHLTCPARFITAALLLCDIIVFFQVPWLFCLYRVCYKLGLEGSALLFYRAAEVSATWRRGHREGKLPLLTGTKVILPGQAGDQCAVVSVVHVNNWWCRSNSVKSGNSRQMLLLTPGGQICFLGGAQPGASHIVSCPVKTGVTIRDIFAFPHPLVEVDVEIKPISPMLFMQLVDLWLGILARHPIELRTHHGFGFRSAHRTLLSHLLIILRL